jgi:DNA-binding MurR/RpiR family transcriptional regulator
MTTVSDATFAEAVNILASARTIHLVGLRSTLGLVHHFSWYLGWIGRSTKVLTPGIGDLPEQLMAVSPRDACVAFSFRRYTKETVEIFKAARGAGARAIAVTDSDLSPLSEHADLTLAIPVHFPAFFESRTAVLSVINALTFGIALRHRRETVESLRSHEQAWSNYGTYANENFSARFNADIEAFAARRSGTQQSNRKPGKLRTRKQVRRGKELGS